MRALRPATTLLNLTARSLSSVRTTAPTIVLFESHIDPLSRILSNNVLSQLRDKLGIKTMLFEEDFRINQTDQINDSTQLNQSFEHTLRLGMLNGIIPYHNQHYGSNFNPSDISQDKILTCLQSLTLDDSIKILFPHVDPKHLPQSEERNIMNTAGALLMMSTENDANKLLATAHDVFGVDNCHNIDSRLEMTVQELSSVKGMEHRNRYMAQEILEQPGSISVLGVGHYEDHNCGLSQIFDNCYLQQQDTYAVDEEYSKLPPIKPQDIVFIYPQLSRISSAMNLKFDKYQTFAVHAFNGETLREDEEGFVSKIVEIVDSQAARFTQRGGSSR